MAKLTFNRFTGFVNSLPHIVKFGMVGGFGAVLKIAMMYALTTGLGVHYLLSYAVVFCMTVVSNFTLNTLFTFNGITRQQGVPAIIRALSRYSGIAAVTLCINEAVVYVTTGVMGYHYLVGTVLAVGVAFLFNFTMSKRYVWVS